LKFTLYKLFLEVHLYVRFILAPNVFEGFLPAPAVEQSALSIFVTLPGGDEVSGSAAL